MAVLAFGGWAFLSKKEAATSEDFAGGGGAGGGSFEGLMPEEVGSEGGGGGNFVTDAIQSALNAFGKSTTSSSEPSTEDPNTEAMSKKARRAEAFENVGNVVFTDSGKVMNIGSGKKVALAVNQGSVDERTTSPSKNKEIRYMGTDQTVREKMRTSLRPIGIKTADLGEGIKTGNISESSKKKLQQRKGSAFNR